jgi:hypothetical protein
MPYSPSGNPYVQPLDRSILGQNSSGRLILHANWRRMHYTHKRKQVTLRSPDSARGTMGSWLTVDFRESPFGTCCSCCSGNGRKSADCASEGLTGQVKSSLRGMGNLPSRWGHGVRSVSRRVQKRFLGSAPAMTPLAFDPLITTGTSSTRTSSRTSNSRGSPARARGDRRTGPDAAVPKGATDARESNLVQNSL